MYTPPRITKVLERLEETRGIHYNLDRHSAELLFVLLRLLRGEHVLEVGTSNGYSAIVLGAAVQPFGGRVDTIERDAAHIDEARQNILEAGLQDVVTVHPGSAHKILSRLPGPYDCAFLDATKQEYGAYFERIQEKLSPRALLVADNVLSHQEDMKDFLDRVGRDATWTSSIVPIGMGLLLAAREEAPAPNLERAIPSMRELVLEARSRIL